MAADRPRRRITQPCLEYNGGLLHKEEIMLRKAMYASLIESKKPSLKKIDEHPSSMDHEGCSVNGVLEDVEFISAEEEINGKHCAIPNDVDNNNSLSVNQFEDVPAIEMHSPSSSDAATQKKTKMNKEPSKLLNYVLKKKKEKKNKARTLLRTPSPLKLQAHGDIRSIDFSGREANVLRNTSCLSQNGKVKKKKRQRGALAVFVAMNKSAGGKLNKSHSLGKELLMRAKKKRKRKQKNMETRVCGGGAAVGLSHNGHPGVESEELPTKKYKKEEKKKPHRMVQAQRKFAKRHPLSPNSMRYQVDNNLYATPCTRAKTEDFLTFLCLRSNPVLPKELEVFNNPCLPMSPLSEEEEDVSSPPSPARSQSSMSNSSNAIQISHCDSPVLSVDSPATGEGPSWESGVVRMYADGPKGLAAKGKEEKKFDELLPSDEADSPRDLTKSVTPPLAFRVSSRPTNLSSHRVKDKQLPRPIPKPFAVKPTLAGSLHTKTSSSPLVGKVGSCSIPPPPSLVQSSDSSSCSPPPPPLLYIPAAAQRVTHLHGPPTLQRFPSTSTLDQESTLPSEVKHRLTTIQDDGPPPLKRFPPIDAEQDDAKRNDASKEPYLRKAACSEFQPISWTSNNSEKKDRASVDTVSIERSNPSVCDSTKISEVEKEIDTKATPWKSKEMPLLRRHSSASEVADAHVKDHLLFSGASRRINSSSSPPRLQRVPISVDTAVETHLNLVVSSGNLSEPIRKHIEASRSRYSPNFPSHPPRLVRHSPSHLGRNTSPAFLQSDSLTLGVDSSRRQTSSFIDLASSKPVIAQSFQETPFERTIPVVESLVSARNSPLFTSSQSSYKSTYVFSNRQTYVQPENETRPLPISALMMPTANGLNASGNQVEVNAMRLQVDGGFSRLNERQLTRPVQSPCPSPSSSSYIHRGANFSITPENRQLSNSPVGFKRIPSPRSDLFSGMSSAPVDYSYMSHAGPKIDSAVSGGKPLAFQPSFRQKENSLGGLPPTWSHLQSPYSISSAASRSSPKPYTFSANLSQASRHSGSYSVLHSNAGTLERYSVGPSGSSDCQYDAWEFRRPNETEDVCVQSVYKLTCLTYFPKNQAGCKTGAQIPFLRPCRNACESYLSQCQVECCDASTQCVFVHEGQDGSEQSGYYDADGPSALCTGSGAGRLASPGALVLLLLGLQMSMWERRPGWARHLLLALALSCATSLQGCSLFIPSHRVPNWKKDSDYLVRFEHVPAGKLETAATLNSCNILNSPEGDEVCSGRGQCKPWSIQPLKVASLNATVSSLNALSFCECDYQWADPECRTKRKSQMKAFFLSLVAGIFGADRFYLGLWVSGCIKLVTLGGFGLWWLYDVVRVGSSPIYADDFKVAADLPHWLYLLIVILVFGGMGLVYSLELYGRHKRQKRQEAMQFSLDEERMLKAPLTESNDPHNPWSGHRSAGYGSTLPQFPTAGAPLVLR